MISKTRGDQIPTKGLPGTGEAKKEEEGGKIIPWYLLGRDHRGWTLCWIRSCFHIEAGLSDKKSEYMRHDDDLNN
jgi:hypothetical protein